MVTRYATSAVVGAGITFALFFMMQRLVLMPNEARVPETKRMHMLDFVRLRRQSEVEVKERELPNKLGATEPEVPDVALSKLSAGDADGAAQGIGMKVDSPAMAMSGRPSVGLGGSADADVAPLVRVSPQYPLSAAERRLEGWVVVEFTISPAGTVEGPVVLAAQPPGVFEQSALQAIKRWKYKPKMENGEPVSRSGVKVKLNFKLENA